MYAKKIRNIVLELVHGDIVDIKADALVNAANNELWMGAGVAGAIKRAGGAEIEQEAMKKGPITIGSSIETRAGKLACRYIIHAAVMGRDLNTNADYVKKATRSSLELANKLGLVSIAFPALGTGVGAFPIEECAKIMIDEIVDFDMEGDRVIQRVYLVLFSPAAFNVFEKFYRKIKV
jgi:O-acetyl-ADP-ribose deacetylase (regulator of RNase III)